MKILFICHGNICRSPMAEYVMKHLVAQAGLTDWVIDSAAVSTEEIGHPVYPAARRELERHGVPCGNHRARRITAGDFVQFDRIVYMDRSNARYLERLFPNKSGWEPLLSHDVADPWYSGNFAQTWDDIYTGCTKLLNETTK